jgi:hypothetical protein
MMKRGWGDKALRQVNELKEEAIAKAVSLGRPHGLFPLTPALSPREREPRCQRLCEFEALGFFARREMILPLPWGEGWGEGERAAVLRVKGINE